MTDIIILAILVLIVGFAIRYIIKAKKSGVKCIGCSVDGGCPQKRGKASACGCDADTGTCGCHTDAKQ